jgi:hypothetical protein
MPSQLPPTQAHHRPRYLYKVVSCDTNKGLFKLTVMFFSLTNSPATFQMMMNTLFRDLIVAGKMTVYMDNMAIHTKREKDKTDEDHTNRHRRIINEVLHILDQHDLFLNPEKCDFELSYIDFLGVQVGEGKVQMEESKVKHIKSWTPP